MKKLTFFGTLFLGFIFNSPFVYAESFLGTKELFLGVGGVVNILIGLAIAFALLFFFWGLAKFILHAGDEEARREGKKIMMWGIISLFVIVSIWGIVEFLQKDLLPGINDFSQPVIFPGQEPPIGNIGPFGEESRRAR